MHKYDVKRNGKRKLGPAEEGNLRSKRRKVANHENVPTTSRYIKPSPKGKRPRTSAIRKQIKTEIERALKTDPSPVAHLFSDRNEDGDPCAKFSEVIACIPAIDKLKVGRLSPDAILNISNITTIFEIYKSMGELKVSYRPIEYDIKKRTVYLDNLPMDCNPRKLERLLAQYGVVAEVKMPLTSSKKVSMKHGLVEIGKRHKRFAFALFTEEESASNIIDRFARNCPCSPSDRKNRAGQFVPVQLKWIKSLQRLKRKGRKRTFWETQFMLRIITALRLLKQKEKEARNRLKKARKRKLKKELRSTDVDEVKNPCSSNRTAVKASKKNKNSMDRRSSNKSIEQGCSIKKEQNHVKAEGSHEHVKNETMVVEEKRNRPRKRKKRSHPAFIKGPVADYFSQIQVIPFDRYSELRSQYLGLRRDSLCSYVGRLRDLGLISRKRDIESSVVKSRDEQWTVQD